MSDCGRDREGRDTRTAAALLRHLGITPPETFEEYLAAVTGVATKFYGGLKLGFLVVREDRRGRCSVHELPVTSKR